MPEPSATYTGDPENVPIDQVRLLVGDTNVTKPRLFDSEIDWCISEHGEGLGAAVRAAELIAAKCADSVDYGAGKSRQSLGALYDKYMKLADNLRSRMAMGGAPWVGGLSDAEALTDSQNTDLRGPSFYKDQFKNPLAPQDPGSGD